MVSRAPVDGKRNGRSRVGVRVEVMGSEFDDGGGRGLARERGEMGGMEIANDGSGERGLVLVARVNGEQLGPTALIQRGGLQMSLSDTPPLKVSHRLRLLPHLIDAPGGRKRHQHYRLQQ